MFYKEFILSKETVQEFAEKYFAEFAVALYEKVSAIPADNFQLAIIHDIRLPPDRDVVSCLVTQKSNLRGRIGNQSALGVLGHFTSVEGYLRIQVSRFNQDDLPVTERNKENQFLRTEVVSLEEFTKRFSIDEGKLIEARKILVDFNTLVSTKIIQDKNGEAFTVNIIENGDATIGGKLVVDRAVISDSENHEIGYLLMKYITPDILKKCGARDPQKDAVYDYFMNVAGVDYARIDEAYQGRGLASQMYLIMAEHLNKKGIQFRGSGIQSDQAKRLWNNIAKEYPDKVIWKKHPENKPKDKCVFFQTEFLPINEAKKSVKRKTMKSLG